MTEDILDLLAMILVLAIVVAIAFGLIIPLLDTQLMGYNENLEDKSVTGQYEGLYETPNMEHRILSAEEVILMTQVQDEGMPLPRAFNIEDKKIKTVESTYRMEILNTGYEIWGLLSDKTNTGRYTIDYDFEGTPSSPWTEAYKIKRYVD